MSFLGPTSPHLRFGPFELDAAAGELRKAGILIKLQPQPFRLLLLLAESAGAVVTREEIQQCLWSESTFVDFEHGINFSIKKIRGALADNAEEPRYIETLPRRGYRFIAEVHATSNGKNGTKVAAATAEIPPTREINLAPPAELENDREPRHPSGSYSRTAPDTLKSAAGVVLLVISSVLVWLVVRHSPAKNPPLELKLRQLTTNPSENAVSNGAISPDGRYLAYVDTKGIQIKLIETGETRAVPPPEEPNSKNFEWRIAWPWFSDSTRFLAESHPPGQAAPVWTSQGSSIWIVSVLAGPPHKLRDEARVDSISPDGSTISFGTNSGRRGDREIWLMGPDGENARKLFEADEDSSIGGLRWFPHGQRVWYGAFDKSGFSLVTRELGGGPVTTIPLPPEVTSWDVTLLPDSRLLYVVAEQGTVGSTCNYWVLPLDERTGAPTDKPKRLTNWGGTCPIGTSMTADGKKLAFFNWGQSRAIMVETDLETNGKPIANMRRFASSEGWDNPLDWTGDSKEVIFASNRNGHFGIFRQLLAGDAAKPIVYVPKDVQDARLSPDGTWLLYLDSTPLNSTGSLQLMRVPLTGGPPQLVLTARSFSEFRCARSPSTLCVISEATEDRKQFVFTAFDPLQGRGSDLARIDIITAAKLLHWDLSPDGTHLCIIKNAQAPIEILSLHGDPAQTIHVKDWNNLESLNWAADGQGFFISNGVHGGGVLLHVDLRGNANVLRTTPGVGYAPVWPSPDGRHLVIQEFRAEGNIWTLENF